MLCLVGRGGGEGLLLGPHSWACRIASTLSLQEGITPLLGRAPFFLPPTLPLSTLPSITGGRDPPGPGCSCGGAGRCCGDEKASYHCWPTAAVGIPAGSGGRSGTAAGIPDDGRASAGWWRAVCRSAATGSDTFRARVTNEGMLLSAERVASSVWPPSQT